MRKRESKLKREKLERESISEIERERKRE